MKTNILGCWRSGYLQWLYTFKIAMTVHFQNLLARIVEGNFTYNNQQQNIYIHNYQQQNIYIHNSQNIKIDWNSNSRTCAIENIKNSIENIKNSKGGTSGTDTPILILKTPKEELLLLIHITTLPLG